MLKIVGLSWSPELVLSELELCELELCELTELELAELLVLKLWLLCDELLVLRVWLLSLLDDERETMGAALIYLGYSINTTNEAEVDEAAALIKETKDRVAAFSSSGYWDLLTSGETVVSQGWNGDFLAAYDEASTDDYDAYEDYGYAIPVEGAAAWVDTIAVPSTVEHPCTAQTFINFILDAFNGAELTNYNYYASPNAAAEESGAPPEVWRNCCLEPEEQPFYERVIQERAWTSPIWYAPSTATADLGAPGS